MLMCRSIHKKYPDSSMIGSFRTNVSFPPLNLDMTPYATDTSLNGEAALYDLRAVCNRIGSLDGAHTKAIKRRMLCILLSVAS